MMMLIVKRQQNESIMIGSDIEIVVVDVRGDIVRLGVTAPKELAVHRREIYDAIQREKKQKGECKMVKGEEVQKTENEAVAMSPPKSWHDLSDFKEDCLALRGRLEALKEETLLIHRLHPVMANTHIRPSEELVEMRANLMLALRHLEDAKMRVDKAMEAYTVT